MTDSAVSLNNQDQAIIDNISHDGRGVVSVNGKKVLIDGVLPGEEVSWTYTKRHRRFDEAKVATIIKPAAGRAEPICPNFLVCGGCSYQHMSSNHQLVYKQSIIEELLEHNGNNIKIKPSQWLKPLQAKTSGYRTKARLGIRYVIKKQKILIGFREKSSNFITDMDTCKVLHPQLDLLLKPMAELISNLSIYDQIPQVELAMGDNKGELRGNSGEDYSENIQNIAVIVRHLKELTIEDLGKLKKFAQEFKINLLLQPKGPESINILYGSDKLYFDVTINANNSNITSNISYEFHPQDFTQVNLELNQLMLNQAINLLDLNGSEKVLDLFCGLGNFTLAVAKVLSTGSDNNGTILGIEGSDQMVARANLNADKNNITNAQFTAMDLYNEQGLELDNKYLNQNYDCVILDPPRSGAKQVLPYIAKQNIKKILYVSCDPATFARDVAILCNQYGYKLNHVGIMDMFPHTKHVETMGLLTK